MSNTYLTTAEVAQLIRRSPGAIRNLVLRRKIPYRKVAGRLVFLPGEIFTCVNESEGLTLDEWREKRANGGHIAD